MTERLHFHFSFHAVEKEMAIHSSVLAWRIPGMGEPDGLLFMGSHIVGHDSSDLAAGIYCAKAKEQPGIKFNIHRIPGEAGSSTLLEARSPGFSGLF